MDISQDVPDEFRGSPLILLLLHITWQVQIFFNNKMDIKINFDQLFGAAPAADLNTTHTSLEPNSIELSHDLTASLNNSV